MLSIMTLHNEDHDLEIIEFLQYIAIKFVFTRLNSPKLKGAHCRYSLRVLDMIITGLLESLLPYVRF